MALANNPAWWLLSAGKPNSKHRQAGAYHAWSTTATAADDQKPLQLTHRKAIRTRPPS